MIEEQRTYIKDAEVFIPTFIRVCQAEREKEREKRERERERRKKTGNRGEKEREREENCIVIPKRFVIQERDGQR